MKQTTTRLGRLTALLTVALTVLAWSAPVLAQSSNDILAVAPNSAERGTSGLLVTFTLDSDNPPPPPAGALPDSAALGTVAGSSLTHDSRYTVTALFDIPAAELAGVKDCSVDFTTPQGTLTFGLAGGFTVTAADAPPTVTEQPRSQIVTLGDPVTFTVAAVGGEPLAYQWQLDGADLDGEIGTSLSIAAVDEADAGDYQCVVSNLYGTATSDAATLSVDVSVRTITASFPIVDTLQEVCYDELSAISCPAAGQAFAGQDAQHAGYQPQLTVSADGLSVYDQVTDLTWQRSADTDGDGDIDGDDKLTLTQAEAYPATLNAINFGGYDDWRLPNIKELFSLMDNRGEDPSGYTGTDTSGLVPFIDTDYFEFAYGDQSANQRIIDSQWATTSVYVSNEQGNNLFGVNFADGRIKSYGVNMGFYTICVRGNTAYSVNDLVDNGDGTITDQATGLMWEQDDNGSAVIWEDALALVVAGNDAYHLGYDDWRLPNIKELHSILDYTRSPYTHGTAAIDPLFGVSSITSESCVSDYPWYWSSTTHVRSNGVSTFGSGAAYICFGKALGYMNSSWVDIHGAGAQRSDSKDGDMSEYTARDCGYYNANAPQGDAVRGGNYVRLVRGGNGPLRADFSWDPSSPTDTDTLTFSAVASGGTSPHSFSWDLAGSPASGETTETTLAAGRRTVVLTVIDAAGLETTVTREVTVTGDAIFTDGFESGDTSAWRSTTGL
ncbi:MAG: DUF1566 domain-containing protein [bacterium]|nr:DUF1566 domain-containing protein [bacterium]